MRWLKLIGVILLFIYLGVAMAISTFIVLLGGALSSCVVALAWPVILLPRWLGF